MILYLVVSCCKKFTSHVLVHTESMSHYWPPWEHLTIFIFLTISGETKMKYWPNIEYKHTSMVVKYIFSFSFFWLELYITSASGRENWWTHFGFLVYERFFNLGLPQPCKSKMQEFNKVLIYLKGLGRNKDFTLLIQ